MIRCASPMVVSVGASRRLPAARPPTEPRRASERASRGAGGFVCFGAWAHSSATKSINTMPATTKMAAKLASRPFQSHQAPIDLTFGHAVALPRPRRAPRVSPWAAPAAPSGCCPCGPAWPRRSSNVPAEAMPMFPSSATKTMAQGWLSSGTSVSTTNNGMSTHCSTASQTMFATSLARYTDDGETG